MQLLQRAINVLRMNVCPRGWAPFLSLMTKICPLFRNYKAKMLDGDCLFLDLSQKMCTNYFFHGELAHEKVVKEIIKLTLPPGGTFIDVGANIGYYTRMASNIAGPMGHVFAFEPLPAAFRLLEKNTSGLNNTAISCSAVGDERARRNFYVHPSGDQSSLFASGNSTNIISVPVVTLDEKINLFQRVDFMKIDVEGYELHVLHGAKKVIEQYQPVICFELLEKYGTMYGFGISDYEKMFSLIPEAKYKLYKAGRDGGILAPMHVQGDNVIAVPQEKSALFKL